MSKLILMCGVPGSGKSTWIDNNKSDADAWISRDRIRFSLLKEEDEYFARENEAFDLFIYEIIMALTFRKNYGAVYADATHLNRKSRAKVLNAVKKHIAPDEIEAIVMDVHLETALERNDLRTGRAFVPRGVIRRMFFQMEAPTIDEGFDKITFIRED